MPHSDLKDISNPFTVLSLKEGESNIKIVEDAYKKAREELENKDENNAKRTSKLQKLEKAFQAIVEKLDGNHDEDSDDTLSISLMPGFDSKVDAPLSKDVNFSFSHEPKTIHPRENHKKSTFQKEPFEQVRSYSLTKRICGVTDESTIEEIRKLAQETEHKSGELLKTMRECAGITVEEISNRLKVSKNRVNSIEACSYDNLPAPVYTKGLVKAYLKYLGISDDSITNAIFHSIKKNTA